MPFDLKEARHLEVTEEFFELDMSRK